MKIEKVLNTLPLYRLPFWFKLFWAKCFVRMFRGFGKTYPDDLILYNELRKWIETSGKPTTTNPNYVIRKMLDTSLYKPLSDMEQSEFRCSVMVGTLLQESPLFDNRVMTLGESIECGMYIIGKFNGKTVTVDPCMRWGDLRIMDAAGNELLNLSDLGFDSTKICI